MLMLFRDQQAQLRLPALSPEAFSVGSQALTVSWEGAPTNIVSIEPGVDGAAVVRAVAPGRAVLAAVLPGGWRATLPIEVLDAEGGEGRLPIDPPTRQAPPPAAGQISQFGIGSDSKIDG
jgi:hypothetical protein